MCPVNTFPAYGRRDIFVFYFSTPAVLLPPHFFFRGGGYFYEVATNANGRHLSDTFCWRFYLTRSGLNKFPSHSQTITRFGAKMFAGGSLAPASPDRKTLTGPGPKYIYIYTAVPPFTETDWSSGCCCCWRTCSSVWKTRARQADRDSWTRRGFVVRLIFVVVVVVLFQAQSVLSSPCR